MDVRSQSVVIYCIVKGHNLYHAETLSFVRPGQNLLLSAGTRSAPWTGAIPSALYYTHPSLKIANS